MQKFRNLNNPRQTVLFEGEQVVGYTGIVKFPLVAEEWELVEYAAPELDSGRKIKNPSKGVYDMFLKAGYTHEEAEASSGYTGADNKPKTLVSPHF